VVSQEMFGRAFSPRTLDDRAYRIIVTYNSVTYPTHSIIRHMHTGPYRPKWGYDMHWHVAQGTSQGSPGAREGRNNGLILILSLMIRD